MTEDKGTERKAEDRWQVSMLRTWDFILRVKEKSPKSLKQRSGSTNHLTVGNGLVQFSRSDLHWCLRRASVKGRFTPQPALN